MNQTNRSDSPHAASLPHIELTVCPCCGTRVQTFSPFTCSACGARSVGVPLIRPVHQLPVYGRTLFAFLCGALLLFAFLIVTMMRWYERASFNFWSLIAAAETAAWQLKFAWLPATVLAMIGGTIILKSVRGDRARFGGVSLARAGVAMSVAACLLGVTFIAVTIPARLRQREVARQAREEAILYAAASALLQYSAQYGTLPGDVHELKKLPDPDGRIAAVIANFADAESYQPSSPLQATARAPKKSRRPSTRPALRNVAFNSNTAAPSTDGVVFTNYALVWAGADAILGTDDDRALRDGALVSPKPLVVPISSPSPARPTPAAHRRSN